MRGERCLERVQEAGFAADRGPLRADHWQSEEIAVVACEPRQKSGSQKRRFAGTRGAQYHHEPWRGAFPYAAQLVQCLYDRGIAAEEDAGILGFERLEAAVGRPFGIPLGWPGKKAGIKPRLGEPVRSRVRPSFEKVTWTSSCVRGMITRNMAWSWPDARSTICHEPVKSTGSFSTGMASMSRRNRRLLSLRAPG